MDEKIKYNNNRKKGKEKYNNKIGNSEWNVCKLKQYYDIQESWEKIKESKSSL